MLLQILFLSLFSCSVLTNPSGSDHTMDIRQDLYFVPSVNAQTKGDKVLTFKSPCTFSFQLKSIPNDQYSKDVIYNITEFYRYKMFHHALVYCETSAEGAYVNETGAPFLPDMMEINIDDAVVKPASSTTDESYNLTISAESIELHAKTYVGFLRGLETFSQVVWFDDLSNDIPWYYVPKCPMTITDKPDKSYRGIFLDATIHYISKCAIKKMMDGMMYSKINVLHLQIGSDHSFPFESKFYPNATYNGAFSEDETYSHETLKEIIDYGITRGVRVLLDLGLPGSVRALTLDPEMKELIGCIGPGDNGYIATAALDPLKLKSMEVMKNLIKEVAELTQDDYLIIGNIAEPRSGQCWDNSNFTTAFKEKNPQMKTPMDEWFTEYFKELKTEIKKDFTWLIGSYSTSPILEHLPNGQKVGYIFEQEAKAKDIATTDKIPTIHRKSNPNLGNGLGNWRGEVGAQFNSFRSANVNLNIGDGTYQGGEIMVQGDLVNDQSLEFYLWGRAAAATETLWMKSPVGGLFRRHGALEMRYNARGIKAQPIACEWCQRHISDCLGA